jgi:hypothetical protein
MSRHSSGEVRDSGGTGRHGMKLKHTDAEIAGNAALLLRSGYQPDVLAACLKMAAEGNEDVLGLTPSGARRATS